MSDTHFDVIVLGAGPGGYLAAERLGHAGKKVALVEEQYLGGTCLNVGCIPTKTLLNGAKNYLHAKEASQFGVDAEGVAVNWTQMQAWKDQVVKGLVAGVAATERKAGVTVINGRGHLDAPGRVTVEGTTYTSDHVIIATGSVPAMPPLPGTKTLLNGAKNYLHAKEASQFGVDAEGVAVNWTQMQAWKDQVVKGLVAGVAATERKAGVTVINGRGHLDAPGRVTVEGTTYTSDHVIIATGSVPAMPPLPGTQDNPALVDSTGILSLPEVPKRLAIIGGGVIGVEFASLYATLGSQVTVIEMAPEILPFMDDDLAAKARAAMKDVTFELGCRVESLDGGTVHYSKGEEKLSVEADVVLMAVGRRPATVGWGAEEAGLEINRGVVVDDTMRTNLPNVWAIGDVTGRSLLAHAAYRMAEIASANILDPSAKKRGEVMRWHTVPWAVFSIPEAAGVGLTESAAKREGREVLVAKVPALMSGRFIAENGFKAPGEAKILVDPKTHQVLGIHVLGAYAAEMIWGAQAVLEMELTVEDLRQVVFPHPTVSEVIREAAWAVKL